MRIILSLALFISIQSRASIVIDQGAPSGSGQSRISKENWYFDSVGLRQNNRMGVGFAMSGATEGVGPHVELNFTSEESVFSTFTGAGTGEIGLKHFEYGKYLSPFYGGGIVLQKSSHLSLAPQIGIQYQQLQGELTGLSIFASIDVLLGLTESQITPTGQLGAIYWF